MTLTEALFWNFIKLQSGLSHYRAPNIFPGKKYFGPYRFLPCFFALGAYLQYKGSKLNKEEEVERSKF